MPYVIAGVVVFGIVFTVFVHNLAAEDFTLKNLVSGKKNAASILGCLLGLVVVYPLDRFKIKFDVSAKWYTQILKLVIGLGLVLGLKEGLKIPLSLIPDEYVARTLRYFLIVLFGGAVYPLTFKLWAKLKISAIDKFTAKITHNK